MKIIRLTAENFKKLKAVEIVPNGNMVIVTGANEQGKTSVLDSIWSALGGSDMVKSTKTSQPIRAGQKSAKIELDLGDIIVTRIFTETGSSVSVTTKEGAKYPSPQSMLDKLIGKIAIDPLSFATMDDKKQRATLLSIVNVGIDLEATARLRNGIFDQRTDINREIKHLESQLVGLPEFPDDTPSKETDPATIIAEMRAAQGVCEANKVKLLAVDNAKAKEQHYKDAILQIESDIVEKEEELKALKERKVLGIAYLSKEQKNVELATEAAKNLVYPDMNVFTGKIEKINEINKNVRAKQQADELIAVITKLRDRADQQTIKLSAIDKERNDALEAAVFPINGLSVSDDGVTYKNIPFSQCSSAERLRVSIAIAMAISPKLKIIRITDGSLIDSKNMSIIESMCKEKEYQCWIEKVDESGKMGIYIEDGEIKPLTTDETAK